MIPIRLLLKEILNDKRCFKNTETFDLTPPVPNISTMKIPPINASSDDDFQYTPSHTDSLP
jgi:hypothetical protein